MMKSNVKFIDFYKIFEESLSGKLITVRNYGDNSNWKEFNYGRDHLPFSWSEKVEYFEWTGIVDRILHCDDGHFDIIFQRNDSHRFPEGMLEDCYRWSLSDYLILH